MIGSKVWIFDGNRRVYGDNKSAPIYRGHFVEKYIIGETKQSWILGYDMKSRVEHGYKVKKKSDHKEIWWSEREVEERCWIVDNCYKIAERVRCLQDYDKLRQIEAMLNEPHSTAKEE